MTFEDNEIKFDFFNSVTHDTQSVVDVTNTIKQALCNMHTST